MGKLCERIQTVLKSGRGSTAIVAVAIEERAVEERAIEKHAATRTRPAERRSWQSAFRFIVSGPSIFRVIRVEVLENILFRSLADARQWGKAQFRRESRASRRGFPRGEILLTAC